MTGIVIEIPQIGGSVFWQDSVATVGGLPAMGQNIGEARLVQSNGQVYWWNGTTWVTTDPSGFIQSVANTNSINLTVALSQLTAVLNLSSAAADANNLKSTYSIKSDGLFIENPFATGSQTGVLTSSDWTTFNNKVSATRAINTTAPITGGGDLSADRTIAIPKSTTLVDGYLAATDFTTFNNKVSATRAINTTAPLTGGGDLSADRTIAMPAATSSVDGYLVHTDWSTFNNKEPAITSGTTSQYWRGDKTFQTLNVAALVADAGNAAATGAIGEIIKSSVTTATTTGVGATGVYGNVTSISLTAGDWSLTGVAGFSENGSTLTTNLSCGFSSDSAGATLGALDPAVYNNLISSTSDLVAPVPTLNVSVTTTTTYYLNTRFFYTSGTPKHYGRIEARRVR